MDPTLTTLVMGGFTAAISALFWQLMKAKDDQIADLKADNAKLEADLKQATDVLAKNTDALELVGETQQTVAALLGRWMAASPTSPTAPAGRGDGSPAAPTTS